MAFRHTMPRLNSVVFLVNWPIRTGDVRAGVQALARRGLKAEVLDLSPLLSPGAPEPQDFPRVAVRSFAELDRLVKDRAAETLFLDYLLCFQDLDLPRERIFRILKKRGARYAVIAFGQLPLPQDAPTFDGAKAKLWRKVKKLRSASPAVLANYAAAKVLRRLRQATRLYARPWRIFGVRSDKVSEFMAAQDLPESVWVPGHSDDYAQYLAHRAARPSRAAAARGLCVFLDQAVTHHPDFAAAGWPTLPEQPYFSLMTALFDKIERETGLEVVIAAHPKSGYEDLPDVFGSREVIKGRTVELVEESRLVVMHDSTAAAFAVLLDKPILVVQTKAMLEPEYRDLTIIGPMAKALGLEPVLLEDVEQVRTLRLDYSRGPGPTYETYKARYIRTPGAADVPIWDVVADELERENGRAVAAHLI